MSRVVEFPLERTVRSPPVSTVFAAQIVIFPGVRIEHREFNLAERLTPPSADSGARQRPARGED